MAVITTKAAQDGGAGLHALVIGVGKYSKTNQFDSLTSPVESARAIADWVLHERRSTTAPLHTVEVLISGGIYTHDGAVVSEDPTIQKITDAVREWRMRANSNDNNQLLFYFCGHGLAEKERSKLLASDYGRDPETPEEDLIDFDRVVRGWLAKLSSKTTRSADELLSKMETLTLV